MSEVEVIRAFIRVISDEGGGLYTLYCTGSPDEPFKLGAVISISLLVVPPEQFLQNLVCSFTGRHVEVCGIMVPEVEGGSIESARIIPVADSETPEAMALLLSRLDYVLRTNPGKLRYFKSDYEPNFSPHADAPGEFTTEDEDLSEVAETILQQFVLIRKWNAAGLRSFIGSVFPELVQKRPSIFVEALDLLVEAGEIRCIEGTNIYVKEKK